MDDIKLTKNELKNQRVRLDQLQKYLPTLQLKKALLQAETLHARHEKQHVDEQSFQAMKELEQVSFLLGFDMPFTLEEAVQITNIEIDHENIAGAELPKLRQIVFSPFQHDFYSTPVWSESLIEKVKKSVKIKIASFYAQERLDILEQELKDVTIRVNLFEKVLIPRCTANIKKIKVFLSDLQLSQVSQAKVAKAKIMHHKVQQTAAAPHSFSF